MAKASVEKCSVEVIVDSPDILGVKLAGPWVKENQIPGIEILVQSLRTNPGVKRIVFDSDEVVCWDSIILTFLVKIFKCCSDKGIDCDTRGLPDGVGELMRLVLAVPEAKQNIRQQTDPSTFRRIGQRALDNKSRALKQLHFLGEICQSLARFFQGKAQYRKTDIGLLLEECGPNALPIVTLISLLVGLILAFVGAAQLSMFGAQIYIANLVGLGMAREMGAMMTGVIMAGRTGAAFAARLGTMKVNEEIDALRTMGISPLDFLVLPRVIALILMMPLLCLYADFMGIMGGMLVGVGMLDLSLTEYYTQTKAALAMRDFFVGLLKSAVFGVLVAIAGCMRGMDSGRSSSAVGDAATNAVVTSIVWIIVSDAILTVIYNVLGV